MTLQETPCFMLSRLWPLPRRVGNARTGFTLIELLTVIAIIGLLLGILLPSLSAALRVSRQTRCSSNLRELAAAWHMYLNNNGDHFLQRGDANTAYGGKRGQLDPPSVKKPLNEEVNAAMTEVNGAEVFHCPADEGGGPVVGRHFDRYGTSYHTNIFLVGPDQVPSDALPTCPAATQEINQKLPGLTRGQVDADAARLILMGDFGWHSEWNSQDPYRFEWHVKPLTHNIAFLDGHAGPIKIWKGIHVCSRYTIIPFGKGLQQQVVECQGPIPGE